jgi:hypothetical protein
MTFSISILKAQHSTLVTQHSLTGHFAECPYAVCLIFYCYAEFHYAECHYGKGLMPNVFTESVILLNVV